MRLGLERIEALLAALGHPEAALRIVHVGGTNGKGSVAALRRPSSRRPGCERASTPRPICST